MKRLGVLLLALLLLVGAYLYGPRLLHMVKADLGDFSGGGLLRQLRLWRFRLLLLGQQFLGQRLLLGQQLMGQRL